MSSRDDAVLRTALLDLEDAYARIDDQAEHIAALELENRELRTEVRHARPELIRAWATRPTREKETIQ